LTALPDIQISVPATGDEEWHALREPLHSGWLTQGPKVAAFEKQFALRHGVKHAVAASSGTTALHLILAGMNVGPGDEVIVPAFTWVATANAVVYCGATPVFVDIDPDTYNVDAVDVARKVTDRTRAIIAVHLFGLCADMDAVTAVAPGLPLIEDAACAAGAAYRGRPVGHLGHAAAFSFHPRKSITTGEGGMITTNDAALAERVNVLRNHGASLSAEQRLRGSQPWMLAEFDALGYNYRMTDLQAAIGLVQLRKIDHLIDQRRHWAEFYTHELGQLPWLRMPSTPSGYRHGWQAFVCFLNEERAPMPRNKMMERLQEKGIQTRPGTHAVHNLAYYRAHYGTRTEQCPVSDACERNTIAIPLHNRMSEADYQRVVQAIKNLA
jgi:perosamine synthetase